MRQGRRDLPNRFRKLRAGKEASPFRKRLLDDEVSARLYRLGSFFPAPSVLSDPFRSVTSSSENSPQVVGRVPQTRAGRPRPALVMTGKGGGHFHQRG